MVFVAAGAGIGALGVALFWAPALLSRRGRRGARADPSRLAATVPVYTRLDEPMRRRLADQVARFLKHKRITAVGGSVPDIVRVAVAGNACMLRLGPGADCYPQLRDIVLDGQSDPPVGIGINWRALEGAIDGGPRNPVVQACAGLLAAADEGGKANQGAAPYPQKWWRQWQAEQAKIDRAASPVLAVYDGAADFFPAACEAYFQRGSALARHHQEIYALLCEFFAFEPAVGASSEL